MQRFPSLSRVLVTQTKERLSGQSWTNGPAESRPQRPLSRTASLTISSSHPCFHHPMALFSLDLQAKQVPSARWVGLSQSVEGPETENRFSREERMEFGLKTMTQKPCLGFSLPACPTNFRLKIAAFTLT